MMPCSPGTFQNATGQDHCHAAAPGFHVTSYEAVEQMLCSAGHFCAGGDAPMTPCEPGFYQPAPGLTTLRRGANVLEALV